MNQFNTIPEANLPDLAAGKTIAAIRAVDADGASATPVQAAEALATPLALVLAPAIAPMLGIDYSIPLKCEIIVFLLLSIFSTTKPICYVKVLG